MSRKNLIIVILLLASALVAAFIREPDNGIIPSAKAESADTIDANVSGTDFKQLQQIRLPETTGSVELDYTGFTVAFNPEYHQPNYSVWTLSADKVDGPYSRKDVNFAPDTDVDGCATLADYRSSGFDRGHMAPAADMKWSMESMADCHLLTNMCPQDKRLNSGAWATVEKNARKWVKKHGTLVIAAGPVLSDSFTRYIGSSKIPVPERFFKVIIAPDANPPLGIAFIMPNGYVEGGAQSTVTSIDQVEAITGFDFFYALPDDIENQVESQNSLRLWNR